MPKYASSFETFMRDFTSFGNAYIILIVAALTTQDVDVFIDVAVGLFIIYALGSLIRKILFSERPSKKYRHIFKKVESGSFPSMHVARITFAYSMLFEHLHYPFRLIPLFLIILVAASRVFLRKHYVVDTIFGLFFGLSVFYLFKIF